MSVTDARFVLRARAILLVASKWVSKKIGNVSVLVKKQFINHQTGHMTILLLKDVSFVASTSLFHCLYEMILVS